MTAATPMTTPRVVRIERAVVRVDRREVVGTPKSEAGAREVNLPPHLLPLLEQHLARHVARGDVVVDGHLDEPRPQRAERGRRDGNGELAYFSSSRADVQAGVAQRFEDERRDALNMLDGR